MTPAAIRTQNLSLGYDGKIVVKDMSLSISPGKFSVLIGSNGCGKSTLLKSFVRGQRRLSGDIFVSERGIETYSANALARHISMLAQVLPVPEGITVRQLIAYGRSPYNGLWGKLRGGDVSVVDEAMRKLDITSLADLNVDSLSGGQRQRAWIAMVLAQQTEIFLLDEPTTFLDISHQVELMNIARQLVASGRTVVAVLHDINMALRFADEIIVLDKGQLVGKGHPSIMATPALFADVFDIDVRVMADPVTNAPMIVLEGDR
ncbi:ATP-binding cassette domain-containing protein [Agrobacterium larrymoorei]|uniref:ATP-binding cassette domain-containing protein n=1 Tax=Agrobacterium larrymoorei TaxID=160699 RepID=A0AAF0HFZ8_9HYPH|nr:ATP-binding cassette domain-containing protein [Agrobacterium larrymoorei]WHA44043.1 ATP-binding cassette domain-containing protein [Agrobacterium larrymoorei]